MEYNHVVVNGESIIDLRGDTVTPNTLLHGVSAHNSAGEEITGSIIGTNIAGTILPYGGTTLPNGFLWCQGQAVSRISYSELFAAIGTKYGVGDGTTTFNLPNIQDSGNQKLLWTNTNTSSGFNAQTISIDLSDYKYVKIYYKTYQPSEFDYDNAILCMQGKVGDTVYLHSANQSNRWRLATINTSGVTFTTGHAWSTYGSTTMANSANQCVPLYIYGVREQSAIICTGSIATNITEYSSDTTLNGVLTPNPSFYAPITGGTAGYVLTSNGSKAPTWKFRQVLEGIRLQASKAAISLTTSAQPVMWSSLSAHYDPLNNDGLELTSAGYIKVNKAGYILLGGYVYVTGCTANDQIGVNWYRNRNGSLTTGYSQVIRAHSTSTFTIPLTPTISACQSGDLYTIGINNNSAARGTASASSNSGCSAILFS